MISTSALAELPDLDGCRRLLKSLAALDAVMSPDWNGRYYSFNAAWSEEEHAMMAAMRTGSGGEWFAILLPVGIALRGLDHESPTFKMNEPKPWVFDGLPEVFHAPLLHEPAADAMNSTYCIWRLATDSTWRSGVPASERVANGSGEQLSILDGKPQSYVDWAAEYYEVELALEDVQAIYEHKSINRKMVARMNADADWKALQAELESIGYPEGHGRERRRRRWFGK